MIGRISILASLLAVLVDVAASRPSSTIPISSRIPLTYKRAVSSVEKRANSASPSLTTDGGFWFANVQVGSSHNLSFLLDTGSGDVVLNSGLYQRGPGAIAQNRTFTNSYGTTQSDGSGTELVKGNLFIDSVSFGGLTAKKQLIGEASGQSPFPHDGIIGFSGDMFSQFNSSTWFATWCTENSIQSCRFGLALNSNGTGSQILGELDSSLYDGNLVTVPALTGWVVNGDVAVNGKVFEKGLLIEMDSGTSTVVGPIATVQKIFDATGIQGVTQSSPDGDMLFGYYPCNKAPTLGFSFPSGANSSSNGTIFNIPSESFALAKNGNNCTAVLGGHDVAAQPGLWVVGQPFFQSHYIDHDLSGSSMGFAKLKSGTAPSSSSAPSATAVSNGARDAWGGKGHKRHFASAAFVAVTLWLMR